MHFSHSLPFLQKKQLANSNEQVYDKKMVNNNERSSNHSLRNKNQPISTMKQLLTNDAQTNKKSQSIIENYLWKNKIELNHTNQHFSRSNMNEANLKKDNIRDLLKQQYTSYKSQVLKKQNQDKIKIPQILNGSKNLQKFHGRMNNSNIDFKFQKQAHEDLQLRRIKQKEEKQRRKIEEYEYAKKVQNLTLKTLQKAKTFKKYFNDVHGYLNSNQQHFKSNTSPLDNKKQNHQSQFVQKRINDDKNQMLQKSYQRMQKSKQSKLMLLQDLRKQMQHKQKLKKLQKLTRLDYNNAVIVKDIKSLKNNSQGLQTVNPQITNIFFRRYTKSQNK